MEQWMQFCIYHFHEVEFAKIQTLYQILRKLSIMKASYKVSFVRYGILYPFENLIQRLVIDNKSWSTSFNFWGFLNIESYTTPRGVTLSNKISIQKIFYFFFTILKQLNIHLNWSCLSKKLTFIKSIYIGQRNFMFFSIPKSIRNKKNINPFQFDFLSFLF